MHSKARSLVSHSTKCTEHLVCAGNWLVFEGRKDQSEIVPNMPLRDVHNQYGQRAVGGAESNVPTVWKDRGGLMERGSGLWLGHWRISRVIPGTERVFQEGALAWAKVWR